MIIFTMCTYCP